MNRYSWPWLETASNSQLAGLSTDRNLVVTAGAGAGKTSVLTSRYLNLILNEKVPPSRILAVTFTRNAAAEMKSRIASELQRLSTLPDGDYPTRLLDAVAMADIVTFDSLFQTILSGVGPLFANSPTVRIIEAWEKTGLIRDVKTRFYHWVNQPDTKEVVSGLPAEVCRTIINDWMNVADFSYQLNEAENLAFFPASNRDFFVFRLAALLGPEWSVNCYQFLNRLAGGEQAEEIFDGIRLVNPALGKYLGDDYVLDLYATQPADLIRRIVRALTGLGHLSQSPLLTSESREAVLVLARTLVGEPGSATADVRSAGLFFYQQSVMVTVLQTWFREMKNRMGVTEFQDVQHDLFYFLKGDGQQAGIRQSLSNWYDHVLVDEFQDTNFDQWEILRPLVSDPDTGHLKPKGLFIVGDPKQSIFRFRGAQVSMFGEVTNRVINQSFSGKSLHLADNYRSLPVILQVVNQVFEKTFSVSLSGKPLPGQVSFETMQAGLNPDSFAGEVHLVETPASDRISQSVKEITHWLERAMSGDLVGFDPEHDRLAIIANRNKTLDDLAAALRSAKVAFRRSREENILKRQEGTDLLHLLHWLSNPDDNLSFTAIWRSPFIQLRDESLLILFDRASGRPPVSFYQTFISTPYPSGLKNPSEAANWELVRQRLPVWISQAKSLTPSQIIWEICTESDAWTVWSAMPQGDEVIRNVMRMVGEIGALESRQPMSLSSVADRLTNLREEEEGMNEAGYSKPGQPGIDLLTVHKAKGLTYHSVLVIDDFTAKQSGNSQSWVRHDELGFVFKGLSTDGNRESDFPLFQLVKQQIQEDDQAESNRVFYVAMTRATHYLLVVGENDEKHRMAGLTEVCRALNSVRGVFIRQSDSVATNASPALFTEIPADGKGPVEWNHLRSSWKSVPVDPDSWFTNFTATGLMAVNQCGTASRLKKIAMNRRPGTARGSVTGTIIHQLLAMDTLPSPANRSRVTDLQSQPEWEECLAEAATIRSGPDYQYWSSLPNHHELPFFANLEGRFLQGSVDWLVINEKTGIIIDFKSNQIRTTVDDLFRQYELQFDVYTVAVASLFPDLDTFEQVLFSTKNRQTSRRLVNRSDLNQIRQNLIGFIHRIEKGEFDRDYREIETEVCSSCSFHSWCYQNEETHSTQVLLND